MSKINKALREIKTIDELANRDQWMNQIHPLVKLLLTIIYITIVVSFSKYDFYGVLGMSIYPIVVFQIGEISFQDALHRLRVILPVVCIVGIFNPFFDREIVVYLGSIPISGGMISMLSLMVKGVLTVLASYILIVTTSIEKICYALSMLHLPKIFVTQIMLIYRYITVLLEEAHRMSQAYALRAPGQKGIQKKAWGTFIGQLLLRSMDRAEVIYESMTLRGFNGTFYYGVRQQWKIQDSIYAIVWMGAFILLRICPVLVMIGQLFA